MLWNQLQLTRKTQQKLSSELDTDKKIGNLRQKISGAFHQTQEMHTSIS